MVGEAEGGAAAAVTAVVGEGAARPVPGRGPRTPEDLQGRPQGRPSATAPRARQALPAGPPSYAAPRCKVFNEAGETRRAGRGGQLLRGGRDEGEVGGRGLRGLTPASALDHRDADQGILLTDWWDVLDGLSAPKA